MTATIHLSTQTQGNPNTQTRIPQNAQPSPIPRPSGGMRPAPQPPSPDSSEVRLCGSPRSYDPYDFDLGYCDGNRLPCGTPVPGISVVQSAQALARNVAARIHQNPTPSPAPAPQNPPAESNLLGEILGVAACVLSLGILCMSGCSTAQPDTVPEVPDGSTPPPGFDAECDGRRTMIQSSDPLAEIRTSGGSVVDEFNRQYPGISLPTLDLTYMGTSIFNDSQGNPVSTLTASDPVSFSRVGNNLYVLTANRVTGGYAPATLLVYDVSAMPPRPVATDSYVRTSTGGASNAIVLGYYNPVAMAPMVGNTELDILYGAPNGGVVSTVDPFSNRLIEGDWCSTHSAIGDGGMSRSDAASDVPTDASLDARDASSDGDAGMSVDAGIDADSGSDGSAG